jgi:hypothetical protein
LRGNFTALPDVLIKAEFFQHEEVIYLGVMPPYFGPGADGRQFQAGEVIALVTEFQAPDVDAAIVCLAEHIAMRISLLRPAAGTHFTEFFDGHAGPGSLFLYGDFVVTLRLFVRGATEAAITAGSHQLQFFFVFHNKILEIYIKAW